MNEKSMLVSILAGYYGDYAFEWVVIDREID